VIDFSKRNRRRWKHIDMKSITKCRWPSLELVKYFMLLMPNHGIVVEVQSRGAEYITIPSKKWKPTAHGSRETADWLSSFVKSGVLR